MATKRDQKMKTSATYLYAIAAGVIATLFCASKVSCRLSDEMTVAAVLADRPRPGRVLALPTSGLLDRRNVSVDDYDGLHGKTRDDFLAVAQDVDGDADVDSLGATLYHLLTGRPPFVGTSPIEVVNMHLSQPPTHPRALAIELRPETADLVLAMLEKQPAARPSASELSVRLTALLS